MRWLLTKITAITMSLIMISNCLKAQTAKPTLSLWEGMVVAGYAGNGAFVNFGGPSLKWNIKPFSVSIGMMPTLRIKKDNSTVGSKNSSIMPSTGAGITMACKHFILQVPLYYDAKTAKANGKWNVGVGIGYKF